MKQVNQSLTAYAKKHCACWSDTIGCLQTETITCDQRGTMKAETGKCLVEQSKPCQYFRESVLSAKSTPQRISESYAFLDKSVKAKKLRTCPQCKSAELQHRQKICEYCKKKNKNSDHPKSGKICSFHKIKDQVDHTMQMP